MAKQQLLEDRVKHTELSARVSSSPLAYPLLPYTRVLSNGETLLVTTVEIRGKPREMVDQRVSKPVMDGRNITGDCAHSAVSTNLFIIVQLSTRLLLHQVHVRTLIDCTSKKSIISKSVQKAIDFA